MASPRRWRFHRERTGEAVEIDGGAEHRVWWAAGASVTQGMETGETMRSLMPDSLSPECQPVHGELHDLPDGGTINLCIVSPTGYIRDNIPSTSASPSSPTIHGSAM